MFSFTGFGDFGYQLTGLAVLGTVLGVVIRSWASIKGFFQGCIGLFIVRAHLEDEIVAKAVLTYLLKSYKKLNSGDKVFGGKYNSFRDGKYGYVPFELMGSKNTLFWNKWIPFWFCATPEKKEGKESVIYWSKQKDNIKFSVVFWRFTLNIEQIVKDASREHNSVYWSTNKQAHTRFFVKKIPCPKTNDPNAKYTIGAGIEWFYEGVYKLLDNKPEELGQGMQIGGSKNITDTLYFPPNVTNLIEEVKTWRNLKSWYIERNIPWKRGWCLYGPPGTGKSAIVRAIAEDLDLPLFVYALGTMLDEDLEKAWADMQSHTPCVALFEDFDTIFHGRQNIYGQATLAEQIAGSGLKTDPTGQSSLNKGQLSFGCLLNCLDGVDKTGGIFTVFTTNHIEKLDPALGQPRVNSDGTVEFISTRPGRVDKAIELGYMANDDKKKLARRIFFDNEYGYKCMCQKVDSEPHKKETPAQFQERCTQQALEFIWKNNK